MRKIFMKMKKYILILTLPLVFFVSSIFANNFDEQSKVLETINVGNISVRVTENNTHVFLFVKKDAHTILATKFNK